VRLWRGEKQITLIDETLYAIAPAVHPAPLLAHANRPYTESMPGFYIEHFGCRAARADGEALTGRLRAAGLREQPPTEADVVIVNTCSVTAEADRAARAFVRRSHRLNPAARIVVTGCYAQRAPEELAALAGVAAVVGNSHKALAPEIALRLATGRPAATPAAPELVPVTALLAANAPASVPARRPNDQGPSLGVPVWVDEQFAHSFIEDAQLLPGTQTRPNLKIQEGCGNRCTFCVIPSTRGPSKSLPRAVILKQVEEFVAAGGNELVLSGINLGRWGRDLPAAGSAPRLTLAGLVREIIERTALARLRLSSIEPMDWDEEMIALLREFGGNRPAAGQPSPSSSGGRLARHAHLPLQSGSDAVLRRMHRRYRPWHYVEKVRALFAAAGPDLTLGADVMVGFPGETDREFEETVEFVRALPFGYLHLFPFSPRPGTPGWALHAESPVAPQAVEERMAALRALAAQKSCAHRMNFVGRELEAITLHTPDALSARGRTAALTENFLPLELNGQWPANRLVRVLLTGLNGEGALKGRVAA
jgi:threonylcarbamoyladenosine tRNA methylthiotransferase MtaB